jgi:glycosyltransferase involved in cell wall biosynthesis
MKNTPLVFVIIPTYNRPEMLLDAVASIAAQTSSSEKLNIMPFTF